MSNDIQEKYTKKTKDELLSICKARGIIMGRSNKDQLIQKLVNADEKEILSTKQKTLKDTQNKYNDKTKKELEIICKTKGIIRGKLNKDQLIQKLINADKKEKREKKNNSSANKKRKRISTIENVDGPPTKKNKTMEKSIDIKHWINKVNWSKNKLNNLRVIDVRQLCSVCGITEEKNKKELIVMLLNVYDNKEQFNEIKNKLKQKENNVIIQKNNQQINNKRKQTKNKQNNNTRRNDKKESDDTDEDEELIIDRNQQQEEEEKAIIEDTQIIEESGIVMLIV